MEQELGPVVRMSRAPSGMGGLGDGGGGGGTAGIGIVPQSMKLALAPDAGPVCQLIFCPEERAEPTAGLVPVL